MDLAFANLDGLDRFVIEFVPLECLVLIAVKNAFVETVQNATLQLVNASVLQVGWDQDVMNDAQETHMDLAVQ